MYLVGAAHPHKAESALALERAITSGERLVTDAEVLQEILHRYTAIDRRDAIQAAFDALLGLVDEVFAVDRAGVERAKELVYSHRRLSSRDALHLALMERHGVREILSFDRGFDLIPGIRRLPA